MVFDWVYATRVVLVLVLISFGLASFCVSAAAIAIGPWWKSVLGALYFLLLIFLYAGFAGGAA